MDHSVKNPDGGVQQDETALPVQIQGNLPRSQLKSACEGYKLPSLSLNGFEDSEKRKPCCSLQSQIPLAGAKH